MLCRVLSARRVASLLLILLLPYLLQNLRIWLSPRSLVSPANKQSGFFHVEKDENWRLKFQGTANPDVVDDVAEWLGVGKLGEKGLCAPGSFRLATMETCMPWLGCQEMSDEVTVQNMFARGKRKKVYNATWRGHTVAYSNLSNTQYTPHFLRDVEMLRNMQPTSHVVQLVGSCNATLLTQYHRLGSASKIDKIILDRKSNDVRTIFNVAISYIEAIHFLHNSPIGTRVMTDSVQLRHALSQFLVTDDLRLVLNDLDDIPEVNPEENLFIKCRSTRNNSSFIAPEHRRFPLDRPRMSACDEKSDIWKIPPVVDFLLGNVNGSDVVRSHLFEVHQRCQNLDPKQRPSAKVVLKEYKRIRNMLFPE
ncbi:protein O-mannose kinase-like [Branchiostoma floridae]|uniref:Protein O-mannose kinase n=1 Tax=Branchiostoma floridae TaxID=7739 RepID=A0A9J7LYE5_BRAFL|nr:protein O-mannose kinase-like [Branchiostoma floridae]